MQVFLDRINHDPGWYNTSEPYDPLTLLKLIEKILAYSKDQYLYAILYNQECALYGFNKHNLTNERYY